MTKLKKIKCDICGENFLSQEPRPPTNCRACYLQSLNLRSIHRFLLRLKQYPPQNEEISDLLGDRAAEILGETSKKLDMLRLDEILSVYESIVKESNSRREAYKMLAKNNEVFTVIQSIAIQFKKDYSGKSSTELEKAMFCYGGKFWRG